MLNPLPPIGYIRLNQIVGNPKAKPPTVGILPIGRSTWWAGIKLGHYPKPVKLGPRITAWRVEDIQVLLDLPDYEQTK